MRGLRGAEILAIAPDGSDRAGPDGDGAGGVGIDGRQAEPDQRRERQQRSAAGHGIDGARPAKAAPNAASACQGPMELRSWRNAIREDMRQKFSLTSEEARAIVTAAKLEAVRNDWKVSIAVVDEGGYLLHLERMDGATLTSPEIAALKARTAALSRRFRPSFWKMSPKNARPPYVSGPAAGARRSADSVRRRMRGRRWAFRA